MKIVQEQPQLIHPDSIQKRILELTGILQI